MTQMELLLLATCVGGLVALVSGVLLKNRKVHAEHWLWKKRRLVRARILTTGGTTVSVLSAAAFVVI